MSNLSPNDNKSNVSIPWLLSAIFLFLWFTLLMVGFFWAHKPFDFGTVVALGTTVLNIAAWLGITWLAAALGQRVAGGVLRDERPLTRLALSAGIGLGLVSVVMGILGLVGLLRPLVAWLLVLVGAVLLQRHLGAVFSDLRQVRRPRPDDRLQRLILLYGGVSLVATFLIALAPVTAWDSLTYHLTGPRLFIESGRIVHPVNIPHLGFPLLGQMQFTLGMLLVGDGVAALFHYGYGVLALVLTVALARRAFGQEAAWMAGMILLTVPTLLTLMSWPYVDMMLLFYATAAFYAFYRWRETREAPDSRQWLLVLGLMCGFSGGVKYTAVAVPVALGLSLIWTSRRQGIVAIARQLALVAAVALAMVLPWLVENWLTTGNPVYPFFFDDALYWDEWWSWWYDHPGTGLATTAPWLLPFVPLHATIIGTEGSDMYEATVGPFIFGALLVLPFVWGSFSRKERAILGHMIFFFALNYLLWLNGVARTALLLRARFVFFTFGIAAVLGGVALVRINYLKRPALDLPWLTRIIVAITLLFLLFAAVLNFLAINPLPVLVGLETESDYLVRRLGVYQVVIEEGVNELPPGSQVVFLWETRSYACEMVCHPDPILGRFLHLTQYEEYDAQEIATTWRQEGITHVLLSQDGLNFLLEAAQFNPTGQELLFQNPNPLATNIGENDLAVLQDLQRNYLNVVEEWGDAYVLYELAP